VNAGEPFRDLNAPPRELRPSATLTTGQCFHWKAVEVDVVAAAVASGNDDQDDEDEDDNDKSSKGTAKESAWGSHDAKEWIGILRDYAKGDSSIVLSIRETRETTLYRVLWSPPGYDESDVREHLTSYFRFDSSTPSLAELYEEWSGACPRLKTIAKCLPGVRLLDQDPFECLVSFICSSNNNIPRITKMLGKIREEYGRRLLTVGGTALYSFPSLDDLKERATEVDLRSRCGLGYRAKYVMETVRILDSLGGEDFLHNLKRGGRGDEAGVDVRQELLQFAGVGPKVADCVGLFSLKQDEAIPVDVHVWNIAIRDYDVDGKLAAASSTANGLTPTTYRLVGDLFRSRFPNKAGWAHSLLFVAELPSFKPALPADTIREMDAFRDEEKAKKGRQRAMKQKRSKSG